MAIAMASETTTRDPALERERVLRVIHAHQAELRAWRFRALAVRFPGPRRCRAQE